VGQPGLRVRVPQKISRDGVRFGPESLGQEAKHRDEALETHPRGSIRSLNVLPRGEGDGDRMTRLRSQNWFDGSDEVAVEHRAALRSLGFALPMGKEVGPIVGIASSDGDPSPCDLPLAALIPAVKRGIRLAGGIPLHFSVMALGEDLMKPTAMLYRNLLSMEIEEMLRAYPMDGVVLLGGCDKTIPGMLMGAASANLPTIVLASGSRRPGLFLGKPLRTGTDLWRYWDDYRSGKLSDEQWKAFEEQLGCSQGTCNVMGTASTMACLCEVLGLSLPGTGTIPAFDSRLMAAAELVGMRAVGLVRDDIRIGDIVTQAALENAVTALAALGGSTNAVIHLAALAGRLGLNLSLDRIGELCSRTPVLADVAPSGRSLMSEFDADGGMRALIHEIGDLLHANQRTVGAAADLGQTGALPGAGTIRDRADPVYSGGGISVVRGTLAPDGAMIKASAATPGLLTHTGPAVVFRGYADMLDRIDSEDLEVTESSVLVLAGIGPKGSLGMPEWGSIPVPAKLLNRGVRDVVRISDGRISGTSFGTIVVHIAPEAAVGGPLGLVRDGDPIELDVEAGTLDLLVKRDELNLRERWPLPEPPLRGWPRLYFEHVLQAPQGCDLDFLVPANAEAVGRVEPIIGRS
jgi:dihydroxy-acid dehydratase